MTMMMPEGEEGAVAKRKSHRSSGEGRDEEKD